MNRTAADQQHAGPTLCTGCKIFGQLFGHPTLIVHAEIDAHGRHEQAIFSREVADLNGAE
jgi:hypothetical protein